MTDETVLFLAWPLKAARGAGSHLLQCPGYRPSHGFLTSCPLMTSMWGPILSVFWAWRPASRTTWVCVLVWGNRRREDYSTAQSTYIYRVPQYMSPRRNWDSPTPYLASACAPPTGTKEGGGHTRLRVRGWGSPNSDDWRKSLELCLLCVVLYILIRRTWVQIPSVDYCRHDMTYRGLHGMSFLVFYINYYFFPTNSFAQDFFLFKFKNLQL